MWAEKDSDQLIYNLPPHPISIVYLTSDMISNKSFSPPRKFAIKITFGLVFVLPILLCILLFLVPKSFQDTILYIIFIVGMENVLLLAILYYQSKLINFVAYPGIFIIGIVGVGLLTTNEAVVGVASLMALVLAPIIFLVTPLLIILYGAKSIKDKESLIQIPGRPAGNRIKSVQGSEAVGWGFAYIIIGFIFLSMVIAGLMYASCGDKITGLCVLNQPAQTTFETSTKALGKNPRLTLTITAALISSVYSLLQAIRNKKSPLRKNVGGEGFGPST